MRLYICYFLAVPFDSETGWFFFPLVVKIFRKPLCPCGEAAFSLVEMAAVIAILAIVMVAGIGLRSDSSAASQRTAVDLVSAMADQARTTAIAKRTSVVMALAAPADLPAGEDRRYRVGLFQVDSEEGEPPMVVRTVTALGRWKPLDHGVSWATGIVDGAVNPWDTPRMKLRTKRGTLYLHGIIFDARGGLSVPSGSAPAVIRIGEINGRAADLIAAENHLRVARVTGRIYQVDP